MLRSLAASPFNLFNLSHLFSSEKDLHSSVKPRSISWLHVARRCLSWSLSKGFLNDVCRCCECRIFR